MRKYSFHFFKEKMQMDKQWFILPGSRRDIVATAVQQQQSSKERGSDTCILNLLYQFGRIGPQQMVAITLVCFTLYTMMAYHQHWVYERKLLLHRNSTSSRSDVGREIAKPSNNNTVDSKSADKHDIKPTPSKSGTAEKIISQTFYNKTRPNGDKIVIFMWSNSHTEDYNKVITHECDDAVRGHCEFTEDKSRFDDSEAILISLLEGKGRVPTYRYSFQKWIFREGEPPPHVWDPHHLSEIDWEESLIKVTSMFNLTSTRNPNSDIIIGPITKACVIDEPHLDKLIKEKRNYAEGKNGRVAWFVSHCQTQSRREAYVEELRKHIPVDIYGKCGDLVCGDRAHHIDCDANLLDKHYKFYLSFENSICDDYVTEKLTRISVHPLSVIPVVLGGVDYKTFLPTQTYINVMDFESPKALADYLTIIDQDDELFNTFITRKLSLACHPFPDLAAYPCRLCELLLAHRSDVIIAPNVKQFYGVNTRCYDPLDVLSGVPFN